MNATLFFYLADLHEFPFALFINIFITLQNISNMESWKNPWTKVATNVNTNMSYNTFFL